MGQNLDKFIRIPMINDAQILLLLLRCGKLEVNRSNVLGDVSRLSERLLTFGPFTSIGPCPAMGAFVSLQQSYLTKRFAASLKTAHKLAV